MHFLAFRYGLTHKDSGALLPSSYSCSSTPIRSLSLSSVSSLSLYLTPVHSYEFGSFSNIHLISLLHCKGFKWYPLLLFFFFALNGSCQNWGNKLSDIPGDESVFQIPSNDFDVASIFRLLQSWSAAAKLTLRRNDLLVLDVSCLSLSLSLKWINELDFEQLGSTHHFSVWHFFFTEFSNMWHRVRRYFEHLQPAAAAGICLEGVAVSGETAWGAVAATTATGEATAGEITAAGPTSPLAGAAAEAAGAAVGMPLIRGWTAPPVAMAAEQAATPLPTAASLWIHPSRRSPQESLPRPEWILSLRQMEISWLTWSFGSFLFQCALGEQRRPGIYSKGYPPSHLWASSFFFLLLLSFFFPV